MNKSIENILTLMCLCDVLWYGLLLFGHTSAFENAQIGNNICHFQILRLADYSRITWTAPCKNVSSSICENERPRSACACAQFDQGLHCPQKRILGYYRLYEWRAKARIICACAVWSESVYFAHVWRHLFAWRGLNAKQQEFCGM